MEGIFDGGAVDTCFLCELLEPEVAGSCPRCGSRMRYQPAIMMPAPELEALVARLVSRYVDARGRASPDQEPALLELLETLHRFRPQSLDLLRAHDRIDLDTLRRDYRLLGPRLA